MGSMALSCSLLFVLSHILSSVLHSLSLALRCLRLAPVYPQMGSGRCVPEVARSGRVKQLGRVDLNGVSYIRPAAAVARSAWESAAGRSCDLSGRVLVTMLRL